MKIIVCVKRVPDTEAKIQPSGDGKAIDRSELTYVLNPYDEYAIEEALRTKEAREGTVTVLSLGPSEGTKEIRTALAMGCDDAVHITTDGYVNDIFGVGNALAAALKEMEYDLIFFGKQAVDDGSSAIGPYVSELLGIPCISSVGKLEIEEDKIKAHMPIEGGTSVIECGFPAALTADKGLNEPRYAGLKGIMKAKKKKIDSKPAGDIPVKFETMEIQPPPPRAEGKIVGEGTEAVPKLIELLKTEAKVL